MKPMLRDAHAPLLRAIDRLLRAPGLGDRHDPILIVESLHCEDWASATFVGQRHRFELRVDGEGAAAAIERLIAALGESEIAVAGHIIADIAVVNRSALGDAQCVTIDALTLED